MNPMLPPKFRNGSIESLVVKSIETRKPPLIVNTV
jgi:hypothetical protein